MIHRSYKYRIYPTKQQVATLTAWQAACWEVQRLCILQRRIAWTKLTTLYSGHKAVQPLPNWVSQQREVTTLRADDPFIVAVPSKTLYAIVKRVDDAYTRMRKDRKGGKRAKVRWADKAEQIGLAFRQTGYTNWIVGQHGRFAYIKLAGAGKIGNLKTRLHRPLPEGCIIKQAHLTRAADGWYITLSCEMPAPAPLPPAPADLIGVDLNVKHEGDKQAVAAVSDGRVYTQPDGIKQNQQRLATLQKLVSKDRRVKGTAKAADPNSKRTAKRRARIAKLHQHITREREHTQQYIAKRLVDTADVIAFEKLNLTGMRRKGKGCRKRGLDRAMGTAAPGRLIALVKEKAVTAGRTVVQVDPRNTSQACSVCGVIGERKGLNVRRWRCAACGAEHDRDINAARNIAQRAREDCSGPFRSGVPGERRAVSDSKCGPMNLEGSLTQAVSNTAGIPSRSKPSKAKPKQDNREQLRLFEVD